jgi:hypothetical protein
MQPPETDFKFHFPITSDVRVHVMQSTIHDHFSPSSSHATPTTSRRPARRRQRSDSEGAEGLAAITMTHQPVRNPNLPISIRRTLQKVVYDSEDEDDREVEVIATPKRRKGSRGSASASKGRSRTKEGGVAATSLTLRLENDSNVSEDDFEYPRRIARKGKSKGNGKATGEITSDDDIVDITSPSTNIRSLVDIDSIVTDNDHAAIISSTINGPSATPTTKTAAGSVNDSSAKRPAKRAARQTRITNFQVTTYKVDYRIEESGEQSAKP